MCQGEEASLITLWSSLRDVMLLLLWNFFDMGLSDGKLLGGLWWVGWLNGVDFDLCRSKLRVPFGGRDLAAIIQLIHLSRMFTDSFLWTNSFDQKPSTPLLQCKSAPPT